MSGITRGGNYIVQSSMTDMEVKQRRQYMAAKQTPNAAKPMVQTLTERDDKRHSIRFNADKGATDPAITSIYVSKTAMLKAGIDPDKVKGFKVTLEAVL